MNGFPLRHNAIAPREDAVLFDLRQHVLFGEDLKEPVNIIGMGKYARVLPDRVKEIIALLLRAEGLRITACGAELTIATGFRVHDINDNIVPRNGLEAGIYRALLLYPLFLSAMSDLFVDILHGDHNQSFIVLHS